MTWRREILELTRTLAWASRYNLPLGEAVSAYASNRRDLLSLDAVYGGGGLLRRLGRARLNLALRRLSRDLQAGIPLWQALHHSLRHWLPDYYVPVIQTAEEADALPEVLHTLQLRLAMRELSPFTRGGYSTMVFYGVIMLTIISGLIVIIVPKLAMMYREMAAGEPLPLVSRLVFESGGHATLQLLLMLGLLVVLLRMVVALVRGSRFLRFAAEGPLLLIPGVGRMIRLARLEEVAQGMACFLSLGYDVREAADWVRNSAGSPYIRRGLKQFSSRIEQGEWWPVAWRKARLGNSLDCWVVTNSAMREDPASGFADMQELVANRQLLTGALVRELVPILITLMYAMVAATMIFAIFMPLFKLISMAAD